MRPTWRRNAICTIATTAAVSTLVLNPVPARATNKDIRIRSEEGYVNLRPHPRREGEPIATIPHGATPNYECYARGENVNGTTLWLKVNWQGLTGYYSSYYDNIPLSDQNNMEIYYGLYACDVVDIQNQQSPEMLFLKGSYDREAAVDWALKNVQNPQPFTAACTWFVSQALWQGGLPQTPAWSGDGFHGFRNIRPGSPMSTTASMLFNYFHGMPWKFDILQLRGGEEPSRFATGSVPEAEPGDIIAYDWGKGEGVSHLALVVEKESNGYLKVAEWGTVNHAGDVVPYKTRGFTWSELSDDWLSADKPDMKAWLIHVK